jgi:hypothetical protein
LRYRDRADTSLLMPRVDWRRSKNERRHEAVPLAVAASS